MGLKKGNIGKTEIDAAGNTIYIDFKKAHSKAFKKEGKVNGNERIETESPWISMFSKKKIKPKRIKLVD